nr:type II toxin-antitoxin system VapB family antitoxin [Mesorhizobium sp.]
MKADIFSSLACGGPFRARRKSFDGRAYGRSPASDQEAPNVPIDGLLTLACSGYMFQATRKNVVMTININNKEADRLTRAFAKVEGVGITEAIVIAMREALERRRNRETPLETAARLRAEFGIELGEQARRPLPRSVYDELSGED